MSNRQTNTRNRSTLIRKIPNNISLLVLAPCNILHCNLLSSISRSIAGFPNGKLWFRFVPASWDTRRIGGQMEIRKRKRKSSRIHNLQRVTTPYTGGLSEGPTRTTGREVHLDDGHASGRAEKMGPLKPLSWGCAQRWIVGRREERCCQE